MAVRAIDLVYNYLTNYLTSSYIPQWLTDHTAWNDPRQTNNNPKVLTDEQSGNQYVYGGIWRFDWSTSKSTLMSNLWQYTQQYANWARIRYHRCNMDGSFSGGCSWTDVRTHGNVPSWVP